MPLPIANIAIDGKTGPGIAFSLLNDGPINNARSMLFNFQTNCITIIDFNGRPQDIEMTDIATVTVAIAAGVYTITVT